MHSFSLSPANDNLGLNNADTNTYSCQGGRDTKVICHLQDRIIKSGGRVSVDNIGRHMVNEKLSMTRSIGDLHLKKYGVIALPDTRTMRVS